MKKIVWLIGTFISMNAAIGMDNHDNLWDQSQPNVRRVRDTEISEYWNDFTECIAFTSQIVLLKKMSKMLEKDQIDSVKFKLIGDDMFMTLTLGTINLLLDDVNRRLDAAHGVQQGFLEGLDFTLKYIKNGEECVKEMTFNCENNKLYRVLNRGKNQEWLINEYLAMHSGKGGIYGELEPLESSWCSRFCDTCFNLIQRIGTYFSPQDS